jgi:MtN3 and saliva related transmembrane protein
MNIVTMIMLAIETTKIVGITAGIFTSASMLPQVIKMIKEKEAGQVSVVMILLLIAGIVLWVWYGIMKDDYPIIVTNSFALLVNLFMMFLRWKYGGKEK